MQDAILPALPDAPDSSCDLLNLLYASVHDSRHRRGFMAALSRRLELDITHVHLYHLDQGTMLRYSLGPDTPLFETGNDCHPVSEAGDAVRHSLPGGELMVHVLDDGQLGVVWAQTSVLVHLLGLPTGSSVPIDLGSRHGDFLAYLLPHFASLHALFIKQ